MRNRIDLGSSVLHRAIVVGVNSPRFNSRRTQNAIQINFSGLLFKFLLLPVRIPVAMYCVYSRLRACVCVFLPNLI